MPSILPSRMHSSAPTQGDLDILALLTSDSASLGPLQHQSNDSQQQPKHNHPHGPVRKVLPRRDSPLDPLMISAVLAGSGPMTRHHFGHGPARPGAYANCDNSRPSSPSADPLPSSVVMKSCQAPRSERLRLAQEERLKAERDAVSNAAGTSKSQAMEIPSTSLHGSSTFNSASKSGSLHNGSVLSSISSPKELQRRPRRMSIDPSPIAQTLQMASPTSSTFHTKKTSSIPATLLSPPPGGAPTSRPRVKCMARTRVPTPHGEVFLHLYHNDRDNKEHLALVIDPIQLSPEAKAKAPKGRKEIRSKSLDAVWREGETEVERVVRGAYVGRLLPGGESQASEPQLERVPSIKEEPDVLDDLDVMSDQGSPSQDEPDILPMVRIHSECFTGETIGSMRCDCGEQLDEALRLIAQSQAVPETKPILDRHFVLPTPISSRPPSPSSTAVSNASQTIVPGRGVVIYMRQEGRGIGLLEKIRAYNLQDLGHDTVTANLMLGHGADERKYNVAAEILRDLGLGEEHGEGIRLLTNNPEKVEGMAKEHILITQRVGMVPRDWQCGTNVGQSSHSHSHVNGGGSAGNEEDTYEDEEKQYEEWRIRRAGVGMIGAGKTAGPELEKYLRTKVERMGHLIDVPDRRS